MSNPSHAEQFLASLKALGVHTKRTQIATRSRRRITSFIQRPKQKVPIIPPPPPQAEISPYPHVSTALVGSSTAAVEQGVTFTLPRPGGVRVKLEHRVSVDGDTLWNTQWNGRRYSDFANDATVEGVRETKWPGRRVSFVEKPIIIPFTEERGSETDEPELDESEPDTELRLLRSWS